MTSSSREPSSHLLATDADVTTMWQAVIEPLGWHTPRVYVILVGEDRRPTPVVLEIDEIPDRLTFEDAQALMRTYTHLIHELGETGSLAILVCRPGPARLTEDDRACCRDLYAAGRRAEVPLDLLHVGTDTAIVPAPMDEVLSRTA